MMKKFAIFNIIAVMMLLITISSALATILNTNIDVTSIDKYNYDTIMLTSSKSSYNAPLLKYKISTDAYTEYSTLYDTSKMSYIEDAIYPYYQHTYMYDSNTNTELFFSPSNNSNYYKKVSSSPYTWVNYALPLPGRSGYVLNITGLQAYSNSHTPLISFDEAHANAYCGGFACVGTVSYLYNYDIALFQDLSSYAGFNYSFYRTLLFQNYYEFGHPFVQYKNKLRIYDFNGFYTDTNINLDSAKRGIGNGNHSQIIALYDAVPTAKIYRQTTGTNYTLQNLSASCSQLFNTPYKINDLACANDDDCVFVGNLSNTSIMISYIDSECFLVDNVTGYGLYTILYNNYGNKYFYGGKNIFGYMQNIPSTFYDNIPMTGNNTNIFSRQQCIIASGTDYLCTDSFYNDATNSFYCNIDNITACDYGCIEVLYDNTTKDINYFSYAKSCSVLNTIIQAPSFGYTFFCDSFWGLILSQCYTSSTVTLPPQACSDSKISPLITNASHSYYTRGYCAPQNCTDECETDNLYSCYDEHFQQKCTIGEDGCKHLNITQECMTGDICVLGNCILNTNISQGQTSGLLPGETDTSVLNFINSLFGTSGSSMGAKALVAFGVTLIAVVLTVIIFSATGLIEMAGLFAIFETIIFTVLFALLGFYPLWLTIVFAILAAVAVVLFVKAIFING